jgi:Fe-coproporphyrin III synthase
MTTLISISAPESGIDSAGLEAHRISTMPVVVMSPHNQCDCHCVMCDIWKIRDAEEVSIADLERQMESFRNFGVRWVAFTGGEPQKNQQLPMLARKLHEEGIRITLLTAGLLLDSEAESVVATVDDVIVSLDGPAALHNRIRRVPKAFERLAEGVRRLRSLKSDIPVSARCTVQKLNHCWLRATAASARELGLDSISYLAADVTTSAFNRHSIPEAERGEKTVLNAAEVEALDDEIQSLIVEHAGELASGFIAESPDKLNRIVQHFRARLRQCEPVAPRCNAPWVSTVIEANGDVRPCFFHRPLGNTRDGSLEEILNSTQALRFRKDLDIATDAICRRCVCSLYIANTAAFGANCAVPRGARGREEQHG